jgi:methionyl-tRNA synthetase
MTQRFYVTTPIYYLNAAPHVGHAYSTIVADALARYHRMRGHDTRFLTGTDEHGQKIQQAAEKLGRTPQAHVDLLAEEFRQLWPKLNIEPDDFIRTTDERHVTRVQDLWRRVAAAGDIYLGHYEGWYCVADEAFYTEKELIDGVDGEGKAVKLSPSKRPVEWVREEGYFFRLSKYQDRLLKFFEENPTFVQPEGRFNEVKRFVEAGLVDLNVSRSSFSWGIPVPGDPKHVIYVWFDALTNYWSALGNDDDPLQRFWPCDIHVVGKEISRFHAVFWPAFLMAAGLPLPRQVYAHGWLTVNGEKMSKGADNFLPPGPIVDEVGADALRYYLLRAVALGQDGDFSHQDLLNRINSELGNDLGNLLNRTLGLCSKAGLAAVPAFEPGGDLEAALRADAVEAARKAAEAMDAVAPHRALEAIWAFCRAANVYVDKAAPWKAQKEGNTARLHTILGTLLSACRALALVLAPFLPQKAAEMRAQLGLAPLATALDQDLWPRTWTDLQGPLGKAEPLFPRLDEARQKQILDALVPKPAEAPAAKAEGAKAEDAKTEGAKAEAPAALPAIDYEKFSEVDLRVGLVRSAERVPRKDKLLDLRVDVGEAEPRRIVAGLALSFKPEDLVGRRVIVVANLAPRDFGKGLVSHGMLLATGPSEALSLVSVDEKAAPGSRVKLEGKKGAPSWGRGLVEEGGGLRWGRGATGRRR